MRSRLSSASRILSNRFLLLLMLGWGAYGPILGNRLPHADDLGFHQLRLAQLNDLARQGIVFSRWFPDLAHGYGYPLFNYMAPLAYYFALPWTLLGLSVPQALQISFALGIVLAGWTMQRLLADWLPPLPALAGGVAFMYAPYFSYDVLFRGNYGESLALCWMPLALWGAGRAARGGGTAWAALGGLAYAAVVLSHNVSGLIFSPLLALFAALEWWAAGADGRARRGAVVALTLAIGLAVSAFFWLPALAETDAIALDRLMNNASYDYRNNFQPWSELLAWPTVVYRDRLNPSPPPALGAIPLLLGLSGWLRWRQASASARRQLLLWSALLAGFLLLLRPLSLPLWDALPLIEFLQFPWRLLAVASLLPALLIGWSLQVWHAALPPRAAAALPLLAIALLIAAAQPWLYPAYGPRPADVTVADSVPYEVATGTLGATATGEYLPATVRTVPDGPPDWRLRLADGAIVRLDDRPLGLTAEVVARGAQTVTFSQFAFAGWWAAVDGRRVPIEASDPHGLVTFDVPDGRSIVTVGFGPTPLRWAATVTSLAGLLAAVALLWRGRGASRVAPDSRLGQRAALGLLAIGMAAGAGLPQLRPTRLAADGTLPGAAAAPVPFDGGLLLLKAEMPALVRADEAFNVTLYWRAEQTPQTHLLTTVALRDAAGVLWSPKKSETPPRFRLAIPTYAWPTDRYAVDAQRIVPLAGTPPGRYEVVVTLFERASLRPLPVRGSSVTDLKLGVIQVEWPDAPVALQPRTSTNLALDDGLTLIGYESDRAAARPGDPLLLTLFWRAADAGSGDYQTLNLALVDAGGTVAQAIDFRAPQIVGVGRAGDRWRTQHALRLPAALASGDYRWQIAVCSGACGEPRTLGALAIDAPERSYHPPDVAQPVGTAVGPGAVLYGVSSTWQDGSLTVAPVWQATGLINASYRVFVHVLGPDGGIVAQSDGEPVQWSRPTTGWLPGEYVRDAHVISLSDAPAAGYRLRIGAYLPDNGELVGQPVELPLELP